MRNRIQRHLAAQSRRVVSAQLRGKGVGGFMTRRREEKDNIVNESEEEEFGSDRGHREVRLGFPGLESKPERSRESNSKEFRRLVFDYGREF